MSGPVALNLTFNVDVIATACNVKYSFAHSFIHSFSSPFFWQPLPKPELHRVLSSASPFNFLYPIAFWRYSDSCLRLLPRVLVTYILRQPLPKPVLHRVLSSASPFNFPCPIASWRYSGSCIRLLPRVLVTSSLLSIFPSITCFRRQFLRKMWPIQVAFLPFYFK